MLIFVLIVFLLTAGYALLMLLYRTGWIQQPVFHTANEFQPSTNISIIIPARNEEQNIGACIGSILAQNYPLSLFEIIVIDDHSTDKTYEVVTAFKKDNVRCIRLSDYLDGDNSIVAYKKKALATGIAQSKGALIVTTDADCIAGENWLKYIAAIYEREQAVMVVAPVCFSCDNSVVQMFQSLDFMSMQGITGATHRLKLGNMSNGANLAFSKEAFYSVNGYEGVDHLASGDDYLLMMKLQKAFPGQISYLKSEHAIVHTAPQPDWGGFLQQRIRWASKSGKYDDKKMTGVLMFVYLFNLMFLALFITAFFSNGLWLLLFCAFGVKTIAELIYLFPVARFFNKQKQLSIFLLLQPLHVSYIIIAGFLGFVGVYKWKGRNVR